MLGSCMRRRTVLQLGTMSALTSLVGCLGSKEDPDDVESGTKIVEAKEGGFEPVRVEIEPGDTIRWINRTDKRIEIRSSNWGNGTEWTFGENLTGEGEYVEHTFEKPGVYHYYDILKQATRRCGGVFVGEVEYEEDFPCEGMGLSVNTHSGHR